MPQEGESTEQNEKVEEKPDVETTEGTTTTNEDGKTFDAGYVKSLRDEAAKHRVEARDLAARVKEFEDKGKSESERLEERAKSAETAAAKATAALARAEVALEKNLTPAQAKRLVGATKDELLADADELLETFKSDGGQEPTRRPKEHLRPGGAPEAEVEENDPAKLAAKVPRPY